jgi:hypothetical protein
MPSGDWATVKPYSVDTRRHTSETKAITHHSSATPSAAPSAASPAGDTIASTVPATTTTAALPSVDSSTDPTSRPVGTTSAIRSAGAGVAGSTPWWAASR